MKKVKNILLTVILPFLIAILITFVIKTFFITVVNVDGSSMEPNLQNKEKVLLVKTASIKRYSVIVFDTSNIVPGYSNNNNSKFIKRVIGMPGDKLSYSSKGKLYINGKYIKQPFISNHQRKTDTLHNMNVNIKDFNLRSIAKNQHWKYNNHTYVVPKNDYFVMGDNRKVSYDSRSWGFVPKSKINGVAYAPFWQKNHQLINDY